MTAQTTFSRPRLPPPLWTTASRLLNDLKSYFKGQYYALAVASTYKTSSGDACIDNPTWCDLDTFDASANTWTVTWTYVRGTSVDGMDSVLTWNTGQ